MRSNLPRAEDLYCPTCLRAGEEAQAYWHPRFEALHKGQKLEPLGITDTRVPGLTCHGCDGPMVRATEKTR